MGRAFGRGILPAAALPSAAHCGRRDVSNAVALDPMIAAVKALLEQAMRLSPEERAELSDALDASTADAPALSPEDLAATWRHELDRRREELERGEIETVDAREAIVGIRARLR